MEIRNDFLKKNRMLDNKFPVRHSGYSGTCGAATTNTVVLGLAVTPAVNYFSNMFIEISYTNYPPQPSYQQIRKITAYDPATDKVTVEQSWSTSPNGSNFVWRIVAINSGNYYSPAEVEETLKDQNGAALYTGILYFDYNSGNDSTGNGSFANPFKTISGKAASGKLCYIKSNVMEAENANLIGMNGDGITRDFFIAGYNTRVRFRRGFFFTADSLRGAIFNLDFIPQIQPNYTPYHAFYLGSFSCSFFFQAKVVNSLSGSLFASFFNGQGPSDTFYLNTNLASMIIRNCHLERLPVLNSPSSLLTIMESSIMDNLPLYANIAVIRSAISGNLTVEAVHALTDTVQVGGDVVKGAGYGSDFSEIPNLVRQTLAVDSDFHNIAYWRMSCRRESFSSVYDLPILISSDTFSLRPSYTAVNRLEYIDGTDSLRALWKRNQKGLEVTLTMPESSFNDSGLEMALRPTYYLLTDELRDETLSITLQAGINGGKGNLIQLNNETPSPARLETVGAVDMGGGVTVWVYFKDIVQVGGIYYYQAMTLNAADQYLFSQCVYKSRSIHIHYRLFTLIDAPVLERITYNLIRLTLKFAAKYLSDPSENALLEG